MNRERETDSEIEKQKSRNERERWTSRETYREKLNDR